MTEPANTTLHPDSLKYTLATPQGRRVLWDLLGFAGLFRQPRVPGDPGGTDFNCGSLNVGLMLYADCLTVSPDLTAMMIKEQGSYDNASIADTRPDPRPNDSDRGKQGDSIASNTGDSGGLGFNRLTGRRFDED